MADEPADLYPGLRISLLRGDTPDPNCTEYPDRFWAAFTAPSLRDPRYGSYENGASVLVLPDTFEAYWEAVGYYTRRKVRKALKSGYVFGAIDRDQYLDDIHAINTSMPERQGRQMKAGYLQRPDPSGPLPEFGCQRHRLATYGVLKDGVLVAYTWIYQIGEMCLFSTILGHGEHLANGIMYLLVSQATRDLMATSNVRFPMYNMHLSGTEGLRFFKEQMGFRPYVVRWVMGDDTDSDRATQRERALLNAQVARWRAMKGARGSFITGFVRRVGRRVRREIAARI